jgi:hypothetical protein
MAWSLKSSKEHIKRPTHLPDHVLNSGKTFLSALVHMAFLGSFDKEYILLDNGEHKELDESEDEEEQNKMENESEDIGHHNKN